jgi:plasmid stabilization system protein ParE
LGQNPLRFQLVERYASRGVRRRVHGQYLIFYRVDTDAVRVVRIINGARDYEALLFGDSAPD